jgi:hypothetical protein
VPAVVVPRAVPSFEASGAGEEGGVRCKGRTAKGRRCGYQIAGGEFCHRHDPERAEQRKAAASAAGKARQIGRGRTDALAEYAMMTREVIRAVVREELLDLLSLGRER